LNLHWKVKNPMKTPWPNSLSLVPIMSKPLMRTFFASNINSLPGESTAEMKVSIDIPAQTLREVKDFLVLMFKIKTAQNEPVGPNFVLFIKIANPISLESSIIEENKTEAE